jgi:hypothetical protein
MDVFSVFDHCEKDIVSIRKIFSKAVDVANMANVVNHKCDIPVFGLVGHPSLPLNPCLLFRLLLLERRPQEAVLLQALNERVGVGHHYVNLAEHFEIQLRSMTPL